MLASILDLDLYAMVREIPADIQKNRIRLVIHSGDRQLDLTAALLVETLKRVNIFFITDLYVKPAY